MMKPRELTLKYLKFKKPYAEKSIASASVNDSLNFLTLFQPINKISRTTLYGDSLTLIISRYGQTRKKEIPERKKERKAARRLSPGCFTFFLFLSNEWKNYYFS